MEYHYITPDENGGQLEHQTSRNAVVCIGANGSGKTRLGVWMEQSEPTRVFRMTALRDLTFGIDIPAEGYEQATNMTWYGPSNTRENHDGRYITNSYHSYGQVDYVASIVSDFDHILAAIMAKNNIDACSYMEQARKSASNNEIISPPADSTFQKLVRIWLQVFPQVTIAFYDTKPLAHATALGSDESAYPARQMSDGERAGLYLIAQSLCLPEHCIALVDEPELHLHPSIMANLWTAIEMARPDCLFVYFTHDTQFAASRLGADKYWIRRYDGTAWDIEQISDDRHPDGLLMDILGSRRPVILVEGVAGNWDHSLFCALYPDHLIVPCETCANVISRTKSLRGMSDFHRLEVFGVIDRDRLPDEEVTRLEPNGVYVLKVAEVENLLLVEDVMKVVEQHQHKPGSTDIAKQKLFSTKFEGHWKNLAEEYFIAGVRNRLSHFTFNAKSIDGIKNELSDYQQTLESQHDGAMSLFQDVVYGDDYNAMLELLNDKNAVREIDECFGFQRNGYRDLVLSLLAADGREAAEIRLAMKPYLPNFTPDICNPQDDCSTATRTE